MAPCATDGSISSGVENAGGAVGHVEPVETGDGQQVASAMPSLILRSRVSTLPRSVDLRDPAAAPASAPAGAARRCRSWPPAAGRRCLRARGAISASRGSSRGSRHGMAKPGRAASRRPSSSARPGRPCRPPAPPRVSLMNSPLPPTSASVRSVILSPVVRIGTISTAVSPLSSGQSGHQPGLDLVGLDQGQGRSAGADAQAGVALIRPL